jgi:hypothetical protein
MELAKKILNGFPISKSQRRFVQGLFMTILIVRGKVNFRNLSRYSTRCEKTYARQFAKPFPFVDFNRQLINATFGFDSERVVAFDASFIPKAGHHTFGRNRFWNGLKSRSEKGLEVSALAVVDLTRKQALNLSVQQTRSPQVQPTATTLIDQYLSHIRQVQPRLLPSETYLCIDGGLTRKKLIDGVCALELHLIGKLRCDARMRYFYQGPKRTGRGRQKVYDGSVDWTDLRRFDEVGQDGDIYLYTACLNHVRFQRTLRVVALINPEADNPSQPVLLFSTDPNLDPWKIYRYYKARFHIEFLFQDAKQYTGLADGQMRTVDRLDFHFNAALTSLNLAKAELMDTQPADQPAVCSIASSKAQCFNQYFLDRIISIFELDPTSIKKRAEDQTLRACGKIAA